MSYDLGDVVPLSFRTHDAAGNPANAGAVNLTVTLPDGTSVPVGPITPTTTGVYDHDYVSVQAGRHVYRFVATGTNAGAWSDVFNVDPAAPHQIVSLAETKEHLNIEASNTTHDAELMRFIRASTGVVEQYAGSVVRRTWTETRDSPAGSRLLLSHPPVLSVTSVAESGTTLTGDAYKVNKAAGVLTRVAGDLEYPWLDGVQNIDVVYVAGRTAVEGHWQRAALIIVAHMWETQLGPVRELIDTRDDEFDARQLYSIPRRALELLGEPIGGIA